MALVALVVLVGAACQDSSLLGRAPVRLDGWLHARGTQLYDSTGRPVRLIGVGVREFVTVGKPGTNCGGWSAPSAQEVENIANWGFNSVRVPLAWANLEPSAPTSGPDGLVHHWAADYLGALDRFVGQMADRHVDIVFDIHPGWGTGQGTRPRAPCVTSSMPLWLYPHGMGNPSAAKCDFLLGKSPPAAPENAWNGFVAVWRMLASRYASDSAVVAADVLNEPYTPEPLCTPGTSRLGDLYALAGQAIRAANPHLLLIFEDAGPNDALRGAFELTGPPPFDNEVYSYHLYQPDWVKGRTVNDAYWRRAQAWGVPLLVGEFNAFGYASPGGGVDPKWQSDTEAALAFWRSNGISWNIWSYQGGNRLVNQDGSPRTDLIRVLQGGF